MRLRSLSPVEEVPIKDAIHSGPIRGAQREAFQKADITARKRTIAVEPSRLTKAGHGLAGDPRAVRQPHADKLRDQTGDVVREAYPSCWLIA